MVIDGQMGLLYKPAPFTCRLLLPERGVCQRRIGGEGVILVAGTSKAGALQKTDPTGLVLYWTDSNRVTWYSVNVELLNGTKK